MNANQIRKWYIYKITNIINGKSYIGQHISNSINDNYIGSGVLLHRAYKKYGMSNFTKLIIHSNIESQADANSYESKYILSENTLFPNGYNMNNGGSRGLPTNFVKHKISKSVKQKYQNDELGNYGFRAIDEEKRKSMICNTMLTRESKTDEEKTKIWQKCWATRRKNGHGNHSQETIDKIKEKRKLQVFTQERNSKMARTKRINFIKKIAYELFNLDIELVSDPPKRKQK